MMCLENIEIVPLVGKGSSKRDNVAKNIKAVGTH